MSRCLYHVGDVFTHMANIPDSSVDLIVTSPPFLALRSYLPADHPDKHLEIGSEPTPAAYLTTLLALTREWRRILAPHGSIAIELGDTYSGNFPATGTNWGDDPRALGKTSPPTVDRSAKGWPLPKSLCLIPSLYAASLAYGHNLLNPDDQIEPWRIRNLIVWHRPNPPVGALGDKVRPSTSYITTASISSNRWFDLDAERTEHKYPELADTPVMASPYAGSLSNDHPHSHRANPAGAPPLDCWIDGDVWTIPTAPYKGAHYATYPTALPRRLINLMCPREVCTVCGEPRRRITERLNPLGMDNHKVKARANAGPGRGTLSAPVHDPERVTLGWTDCHHNNYRRGLVCDPFAGSGTTAVAASESGRDSILIDIDERNLHLARERIGLFLEEATQ